MIPADLSGALNALCKDVVLDVTELPTGHIRLQTALQYPDSSHIDVFVRQDAQPSLPGHDGVVLTDFGQTTAWLLDLRLKPWLSAKRRRFLDDALATYEATLRGGAIEIDVPRGQPLGLPVLRLAQACLRMADLMFTQRGSIETAFKDRVEEFLSARDLTFAPDVEILGRHDRFVRVDYHVLGGPRGALVLALGSANPSSAHTIANEVFSRWYDLSVPTVRERRVTVFDDNSAVRQDDIDRLTDVSEVVAFGDEAGLAAAFAA